jgi:hypothetical protein
MSMSGKALARMCDSARNGFNAIFRSGNWKFGYLNFIIIINYILCALSNRITGSKLR